MSKDIDEKVIAKISKLLKLAESPNEAEALAALGKAHALLAEYNLELQDIKEEQEITKDAAAESKAPMRKWLQALLQAACELNYCRLVTEVEGYRTWRGRVVKTKHTQNVYGRKCNIDATILMYDYLKSVVTRFKKEAAAEDTYLDGNQYCLGMAIRIGKRVREMKTWEETSGTGLMVVATETDEWLKNNVKTKKSTSKVKVGGDSADRGYMDGDRVALNAQVGERSKAKMAIGG